MSGPGSGQREYLIVARIRRPHGVRGELLIAVDTDRPQRVFRKGHELELADRHGIPVGRRVAVERIRPTNNGAILSLAEVTTREDAEELRGHSLVIDEANAAPAAPDEIHHRELIGLTARTRETEVGTVTAILDFPGGETLSIRGAGGQEILIPLVSEMIAEVDLAAGTLILELPEGLLEL
ncbi:MAG: ribosome maturation factor RimM [Gemmatimonadota bacterium]